MPLREYQEQLVSRVREAWVHGKKAPCIVLPCGGGKSCIVAEMAKRTTDNKKRVLFLVHRKELCAQIENNELDSTIDKLKELKDDVEHQRWTMKNADVDDF